MGMHGCEAARGGWAQGAGAREASGCGRECAVRRRQWGRGSWGPVPKGDTRGVAHQKVKWCAPKQQMVRSKCSSDGWGKDQ